MTLSRVYITNIQLLSNDVLDLLHHFNTQHLLVRALAVVCLVSALNCSMARILW